MKSGKCPKCGSYEVYRTNQDGFRSGVPLSILSGVRVDEYLCCGCGLVETFLADRPNQGVHFIERSAQKVNPVVLLGMTPRYASLLKALCPFYFLILFLSGCSSVGKLKQADFTFAKDTFAKPHLLYTASKPYKKLYVEIDAVEGAEPSDEAIVEIRRRLDKLFTKKGGNITVDLGDSIPLSRAVGRRHTAIALSAIDGPPTDDSAFLYILFFDSKNTSNTKRSPSTGVIPYPSVIYIDQHWIRERPHSGALLDRAMTHELGHVLGLVRDHSHGDGSHCTTEGCIMNDKLSAKISRRLFGRNPWVQSDFCTHCLSDLAKHRNDLSNTNLSFSRGYFLREEKGYQVLTMPGFVYINEGAISSIDWSRVEAEREAAIGQIDSETRYVIRSSTNDSGDTAQELVDLIANDPWDQIRKVAAETQIKIDSVE